MVVHRGLLNVPLLERADDAGDLFLGEYEIAHDHRLGSARSLERHPRSQRQRRPDFHPVEGYVQIGSRKAVLHDAIGLERAGATDGARYGRPVIWLGIALSICDGSCDNYCSDYRTASSRHKTSCGTVFRIASIIVPASPHFGELPNMNRPLA